MAAPRPLLTLGALPKWQRRHRKWSRAASQPPAPGVGGGGGGGRKGGQRAVAIASRAGTAAPSPAPGSPQRPPGRHAPAPPPHAPPLPATPRGGQGPGCARRGRAVRRKGVRGCGRGGPAVRVGKWERGCEGGGVAGSAAWGGMLLNHLPGAKAQPGGFMRSKTRWGRGPGCPEAPQPFQLEGPSHTCSITKLQGRGEPPWSASFCSPVSRH